MRLRSLALALAFAALPAPALAAGADHNVEWTGLSHVGWQDRRPLCPVDGESFEVRFQSWRNDLTAARVQVNQGGTIVWATASVVGQRGPYDLWAATVPTTGTATESYWIEVTDGSDTDYLSVSGVSDAAPADAGWIVDFSTLEHAPVGATPVTGGGAVFKVWAPTRTTAHVRGTFNGWTTANPLAKVGEYFVGRVATVADRAQYKFFFNNAVWNTDPRARAIDPTGGNFNSYVEHPFRYTWASAPFTAPAFEKLVVYQLHVGTFAGLNDPAGATAFPSGYADVADRVSHLADLGVNAIQLCPITEFPGDLSAGYNPQTQFAPEWRYGTPDQFKRLVDRCHENGIAVLLDVVWNHFTPSDNWLWNYDGSQQWFDTPAVDTPWGAQADFDRGAVRDYFAHSAQLWLDEYRLDGFRMDATSYMNFGAQAASGWSLMQRLNDEVDARFADKFLVAEQLPNNDWVTRPTSLGGAGFDAQYHMKWRDQLRGALFAAASGDPSMSGVRDALLGSGPYISGTKAYNYVELHDEAWPSSGGQRLVRSIDTVAPHDDAYARGRTKLVNGLTLVSPGVPILLQGTEWLESNDFGADAGNRIDWSRKTTYAGIYQFYRRLIGLRRTLVPLDADASVYVSQVNEGGNVIAYRRWKGASQLMVVANFSNTSYSNYRLGVPANEGWQELVNSQDPAYTGSGPVNAGVRPAEAVPLDGYAQSVTIELPAMALVVLGPAGAVDAPPATAPALALSVSPSPTRGATLVKLALPAAGPVRVTLLDAQGRRVAVLADGERAAGEHRLAWDGRREGGPAAAPGLYFVRAEAAGRVETRRLALVR
jgi:1,4-alpha-glucan branching enzyme